MPLHGRMLQGSSLHAIQASKQRTGKYESERGKSTSVPHATTQCQGKSAYRMVTVIKASSTGLSL